MKPRVTVGICVKNSEATIKQAIDSLFDQDFPLELMELIVVDGCSEDRTIEIVKSSLKNSSMENRVFSERKGLGYARQIVVDNAQGDYIIWVDGDMLLSRDFVRKQFEFMERKPRAGIAKGKYGIQNANGLAATLEDIEFVMAFGYEGEVGLVSLGTSGCIYRVKAIKQVGGFDQCYKGAVEDTDVEYRIKAAGWAFYISPAIFYEKRRGTWRSLWNEYFWLGIGAYRFFRKTGRIINVHKMLPPVALITELLRVPFAYRLTRKKMVFLLPLHYIFKRIAWLLGFLKGKTQMVP